MQHKQDKVEREPRHQNKHYENMKGLSGQTRQNQNDSRTISRHRLTKATLQPPLRIHTTFVLAGDRIPSISCKSFDHGHCSVSQAIDLSVLLIIVMILNVSRVWRMNYESAAPVSIG